MRLPPPPPPHLPRWVSRHHETTPQSSASARNRGQESAFRQAHSIRGGAPSLPPPRCLPDWRLCGPRGPLLPPIEAPPATARTKRTRAHARHTFGGWGSIVQCEKKRKNVRDV